MDNFVVSARKYRPATFDSVVGQAHITTTLKNAIRTQHLAQAFLFCGPRGVGKTTCARILAKTINCENPGQDGEACGICDSCVSFQNNASFNIHELDAASNNSVEDIRSLIDQVRYPPQTGKYKIYIIDEVHMLSQSAFNAFLKTLEEPPSYAIFILATTEKHKILPTILSRCQIFDFNRIDVKDIAEQLRAIAKKEGVAADEDALELIAQKAEGGLRDALSMFDLNVTYADNNVLRYEDVLENLHILDSDYYFKMTASLLQADVARALILLDEIIRKGFDGHLFINGLMDHLRNLLMSKDKETVSLLDVSEATKNRFLEQTSDVQMGFLLSALSIANQCDVHYKSARNQRLHVEICLMKIAHLPNVLNLRETEDSKKKVISDNVEKPGSQHTESPQKSETPKKSTEIKLKSTPSLAQGAASQRPAKPSEPVINGSQPLTAETLNHAWSEFTQGRKKNPDQSKTEELTLGRSVALKNGELVIELDNEPQKKSFLELQHDLSAFLRKKFGAETPTLSAQIVAVNIERAPYTSKEKFDFMAKKNPSLVKLKDTLGLDGDF